MRSKRIGIEFGFYPTHDAFHEDGPCLLRRGARGAFDFVDTEEYR